MNLYYSGCFLKFFANQSLVMIACLSNKILKEMKLSDGSPFSNSEGKELKRQLSWC